MITLRLKLTSTTPLNIECWWSDMEKPDYDKDYHNKSFFEMTAWEAFDINTEAYNSSFQPIKVTEEAMRFCNIIILNYKNITNLKSLSPMNLKLKMEN